MRLYRGAPNWTIRHGVARSGQEFRGIPAG
jgi:hypothetical protein